VAQLVRAIARNGIPLYPLSHQAKRAKSAPAILAARIVSTRQVDAARNHSEVLSKMRDAATAAGVEIRRLTNIQNPTTSPTKAKAEGKRAVASVTYPRGNEASEISQ
jgi:hypothetical protein